MLLKARQSWTELRVAYAKHSVLGFTSVRFIFAYAAMSEIMVFLLPSEQFVWWSIFSTLAPLTLQEFRDLAFRFSQKVFGLQQKTSR